MTSWPLTSYCDFPTYQDFPRIPWPWYRAWPSSNYEWFPLRICNGRGVSAGNAYPSGYLNPPSPPPWGTCRFMLQFFRPVFPNLQCFFSIFHQHGLKVIHCCYMIFSENRTRSYLNRTMNDDTKFLSFHVWHAHSISNPVTSYHSKMNRSVWMVISM